ncbi:MAG TPA: hypothetical protein VLE89_06635 [Chlamydiales bacterium]|nr:hypothetical protein [Chlamydiales bacterium]
MFPERCGKLFFSQMRPLFFFLILAFPILFSFSLLFMQTSNLQELERRFTTAVRKGKLAIDRKSQKEHFLQRYDHTDPYFIDQQIESFFFLQKERQQLELLLQHPAFPKKELIQERLSFLTSKENHLSFIEENIRISSQMKETEEKQRHPIQLDEEDLQKLLALIEDIPIGSFLPSVQSPQLLINNFTLRNLQPPLHTPVWEIQMDLLKREFTNP